MENNKSNTMVVLDLSVAFDAVNHKIFLDILGKYFGIQGTALKWIQSYMTNRQFM